MDEITYDNLSEIEQIIYRVHEANPDYAVNNFLIIAERDLFYEGE